MEQYIPKSALVAEIEKLENTYKKLPTRNSYEEGLKDGRLIGYKDALYKINSLEVKEVDIDKEIEQSFIDLDYHLDAYNRVEDYVGENIDMVEYKRIAKHFFELGMSVSNKAQKGE